MKILLILIIGNVVTVNASRTRLLTDSGCFRPHDCGEILRHWPSSKSGVYQIYPGVNQGIDVYAYCDMERSCGGWTVIQKRVNGTLNFKRGWDDYRYGFGNPEGEHWLGNNVIHDLTRNGKYELLVLLEDFSSTRRYAHYKSFNISSEDDKYKLYVQGYSGNAGDSLSVHVGFNFTTIDQDNDRDDENCALSFEGAWWYSNCHSSNLNGLYLSGNTSIYAKGVVWQAWRGYYYSLKLSEMMIR